MLAYERYVELAERLNALAPGNFAKKSLFLSTGAEAVENAVKIARAYTNRSGIIAFTGGYHGRTMHDAGADRQGRAVQDRLRPVPRRDVPRAVPECRCTASAWTTRLHSVELIFKNDIEPSRVAAFIVEPVQGEGGFYVAPPEFIGGLKRHCDQPRHPADRRRGADRRRPHRHLVRHASSGRVAPDLITMAKSMAGGFPISGVVGRAEVMDAPAPGGLGGTYAGSPLGCAAALAVLEVFEQRKPARPRQGGGRAADDRAQRHRPRNAGASCDVRGLGAMVAIELAKTAIRPSPMPT